MNDKQLVFTAINMWKNSIQTGNINMSAKDAVNCGQIESCKMLNSDQQEFVIRLEELAADCINGRLLK